MPPSSSHPYSFDEQIAFARAWERSNGKQLLHVSDWNAEEKNVEIPRDLIVQSMRDALGTITRYAETSRLVAVGAVIRECLDSAYGVSLGSRTGVHISANATQALFAAFYAVTKLVAHPKMLFVCPGYYAAKESARQCGIPFWETWRKKREGFEIDLSHMDQLRNKTGANIIYLTDPVYSAGVSMTARQWDALIGYCARHDLWVLVDMAFSGLSWSNNEKAWLDRESILRSHYPNAIIVDSPSKRLFTNNLKIAVTYGSNEVVKWLTEFSDSHLGNLTGVQLAFAEALFRIENRKVLESVCGRNVERLAANFARISGLLAGSESVSLLVPDSGFHALLFAKGAKGRSIDAMRTSERWVRKLGVLAIPTNDFSFDLDDEYGIRLNLTRPPEEYESILRWVAVNGMPI